MGLAADAAQGGKEKLAEHGKLRRRLPRRARRTFLAWQGQGPLDTRRDVVDLAQEVAALQAAHGADPLDVGRLPLGQFDDQVVAEHAPCGLIAALRLGFAPLPQFVYDRQAPLIEALVARNPPPALARRGADKLFAPGLRLFLHPRESPQFSQTSVNAIANLSEI